MGAEAVCGRTDSMAQVNVLSKTETDKEGGRLVGLGYRSWCDENGPASSFTNG